MTLAPQLVHRLAFLVRVVQKESRHLATTDQRLFATPFTVQYTLALAANPDLAERVEAFVGRFGRLQDTVGYKLLPALLAALNENTGAAIDNLDRAERLGLINSTDEWLTLRNLRNKMAHKYVEDPAQITSPLLSGHAYVPTLIQTANAMTQEVARRMGSTPT